MSVKEIANAIAMVVLIAPFIALAAVCIWAAWDGHREAKKARAEEAAYAMDQGLSSQGSGSAAS